jgi:RNA polymerase sigma-70 factor (ECF subfamily)
MHRSQSQIMQESNHADELYQRHARTVLAYLRPQVKAREDAEDLLVEVFIGVLRNPLPEQLREAQEVTWLRRVAHNKVIDFYRKNSRLPAFSSLDEHVEDLFADDIEEPETRFLQETEYDRLRTHLATLPRLQQEMLHLRFAKGLSTHEIALQLAKTDAALRMLLSRTLNSLRAFFETEQGDDQAHV